MLFTAVFDWNSQIAIRGILGPKEFVLLGVLGGDGERFYVVTSGEGRKRYLVSEYHSKPLSEPVGVWQFIFASETAVGI